MAHLLSLLKVIGIMQFEASRLRKDYLRGQLEEATAAADPFEQFQLWLDDAIAANLIEANAMTIATVGDDGAPSARTVLLKEISQGGFVFTTSFESLKGNHIGHNDKVSLLFYWPALERQVRISGVAEKTSTEESDEFFGRRPVDARISASISPQSRVVPNRQFLEQRVAELKGSLPEGEGPPRPVTWGGYRIFPDSFEFWQGRQNRLHDRLRYQKAGSDWTIERLAP